MTEWLEVWRYRQLLWNFVRRDLKVRYKNSILGFVWSFLNPLFQILVFVIVFRYMTPVGGRNYSAGLFVAMLPWIFFSQGILDSTTSVAGYVALLKKVRFPRLILPISVIISNLVHFGLGMLALIAYFALRKVTISWPHVPLAMLAFMVQLVFMGGLSMALSALSVYYSDVKFLTMSAMQMLMFLCPILIPMETALRGLRHYFPPVVQTIYMLNPLAPIMTVYRAVLPYEPPEGTAVQTNNYLTLVYRDVPHFTTYFEIAAAVAVVGFIVCFFIFRRLQWRFAELG